ncbi:MULTISPECIES: hypothetical protein [Bizionia]|uniref:hypothetical protein n=1 Tax=Bizionia TaxID=283785 RepID=UPI0014792E3D|nr:MULTISPECIES: hypothetical protein [Bizionia]
MFKIGVLISIFAVTQVSTDKNKPIEVKKVEINKKEAPKIALLYSVKNTTFCFGK